MAELDRTALIGGLAAEFEKAKGYTFEIEKCNYIEDTQTLNCNALGLPLDVLEKTRNVANSYLVSLREASKKDPEAGMKITYVEIALKCINEIIALQVKNHPK